MASGTLIWGVVRRVRGERAFYATVVACLAVAIGAVTTVFSVLDAMLLRPLPFAEPEALVSIRATLEGPGSGRYSVSPANYLGMRDMQRTLAAIEAVRVDGMDLSIGGRAVRLSTAAGTGGLLRSLGAEPILGRLPEGDDEGTVILSEGAWSRHFGRDPGVLGRSVSLGGSPREVVGVVGQEQVFPPGAEAWLAGRIEDLPERDLHSGSLQVIGRLAAGVTLADARRDMDRVSKVLQGTYPGHNHGRGIAVDELRTPWVANVREALVGMMVAVGVFLAIACANVAALMMIRAHRGSTLVGLKMALGASRRRILGEHLVEGVALAIVGSLVGVWLASVTLPVLSDAVATGGPGGPPSVVSPRVLMFVTAVGGTMALVFAAAPAPLAARGSPARLIGPGARGGTASRRQLAVQGWVLGLQSALGVVLLVVAVASLARVANLLRVEPGFSGLDAVTFRLPVPDERYPDLERRTAYLSELREALGTIPGVTAVGAVDVLPVGDPGAGWAFSVEDAPPEDPNAFEVARGRLVTPGYFEALGIEIVSGRPILASDDAPAEPVVVVSRALAERYWPGADPVGRRLKRRAWDSPFPWMRVVGVAEDLRDGGPGEAVASTLYLSYPQHDTRLGREMSFVVRGGGTPDQVGPLGRLRIEGVDAETPVTRVAVMSELLDQSWSAQRASGALLGGFGAAALLLLGLGVYGVMARAVNDRWREIGLRMALGAPAPRVAATLVSRGLGVLAAGVAAGAGTVWAATGRIESLLGPAPWWALVLAMSLPLVVGALASALPAARAFHVEPLAALREDR